MTDVAVNLYDNGYADFAGAVELAVRRLSRFACLAEKAVPPC